MNKRKTTREWSSLALIISFNEFAWICFFVVALLYATEKLKNSHKQKLDNKAELPVNQESQLSNLVMNVKQLTMRNEEYRLLLSSNQNDAQIPIRQKSKRSTPLRSSSLCII